MPIRPEQVASNSQHSSSADSSFENVAKAAARTLAETPSAFYDEISRDIKEKPADLLARVGGGVAIGAVGTILLKNKNVALTATVVGLGWQGLEAAAGLTSFVNKAKDAGTDESREKLASSSAHQLGRGLTNFAEAAPGMAIGGFAASKAFGAPPLYGRIGQAVEDKLVMPVKDRVAFIGPGSERLPLSIVSKDLQGKATVDALELSRIFGEKHPWKGVETGQTLDLENLKLSRPVSGGLLNLDWVPASTKADKIPFHTHWLQSPVGSRPSLSDLDATRGLGIIKHGDRFVFYVGHSEELNLMRNAGKADLFQPGMRSVAIDHATQSASRLTGSYDKSLGWLMNEERLDYQATLKALKALDLQHPWRSLQGI